MNKVKVVDGWFYVDGKFIVPFDFTDRGFGDSNGK